jgi:hypothetical protein
MMTFPSHLFAETRAPYPRPWKAIPFKKLPLWDVVDARGNPVAKHMPQALAFFLEESAG